MTFRPRVALIAVAALLVVLTAQGLAHEGHDHKIMGTITIAAADHVMVKDRGGKAVTVKVTKDTKIKSKTAIKAEEIAAGTRVVITATQAKDKSFTAKSIEVGVRPAAK